MWGAHSDERMSSAIAGGPRQRSHSRIKVPRDSWSYFSVSDSRLPQPGGPGPHIYIPQEHGGPVLTTGTGFRFRRLLRLSGLRWSYSNQPPRGQVLDHWLLRLKFVWIKYIETHSVSITKANRLMLFREIIANVVRITQIHCVRNVWNFNVKSGDKYCGM
jgi:hypothetical protein